jgi:hypothetical protein
MVAEQSQSVARMLANLNAVLDEGRTEGLMDGDTGEWIPAEATLTVVEANVPCAPKETVYVLVSDLFPDMPIEYCVDHAVTEGQTPREILLDLAGELHDAGCLGLCMVCRDPVAVDEMALLLGRTGAPSKRRLLHMGCAQTAGRAIREATGGA